MPINAGPPVQGRSSVSGGPSIHESVSVGPPIHEHPPGCQCGACRVTASAVVAALGGAPLEPPMVMVDRSSVALLRHALAVHRTRRDRRAG